MDIKKEFYGDQLVQIHFAGGLVMNMQGFLTTFDTMKKLADRMVEAGILKRNINLKEKLDD